MRHCNNPNCKLTFFTVQRFTVFLFSDQSVLCCSLNSPLYPDNDVSFKEQYLLKFNSPTRYSLCCSLLMVTCIWSALAAGPILPCKCCFSTSLSGRSCHWNGPISYSHWLQFHHYYNPHARPLQLPEHLKYLLCLSLMKSCIMHAQFDVWMCGYAFYGHLYTERKSEMLMLDCFLSLQHENTKAIEIKSKMRLIFIQFFPIQCYS